MASTNNNDTASTTSTTVNPPRPSPQELLARTREHYEEKGYQNVAVVTVITREARVPVSAANPTGLQTQFLILQPRTERTRYHHVRHRYELPQEVVPKGELKPGETVRDALPRVAREMTGLAITGDVTSVGSMSSTVNMDEKMPDGTRIQRPWIRSSNLIYRVRVQGDGEHFFFDDDHYDGGMWANKGMLKDGEIDLADDMDRFVESALG